MYHFSPVLKTVGRKGVIIRMMLKRRDLFFLQKVKDDVQQYMSCVFEVHPSAVKPTSHC